MEVKSEKLKVKRGEVAGRLQIYRSEERVMKLLQRICNPLERSYRQIANLPKREKITNGAYLVYIFMNSYSDLNNLSHFVCRLIHTSE